MMRTPHWPRTRHGREEEVTDSPAGDDGLDQGTLGEVLAERGLLALADVHPDCDGAWATAQGSTSQ